MLQLKPFVAADFDRLKAWIKSEQELIQWAGTIFHWPLDRAQLQKYLNESKQDNSGTMIFAATIASSQEIVGHVELSRIDNANKSCRLSRVLVGNTTKRSCGLGTAIVRAALSIAFNKLNLHRVELVVYTFNHAAIECYKKIGFQMEGTLRDTTKFQNEYWSVHLMSILETELP